MKTLLKKYATALVLVLLIQGNAAAQNNFGFYGGMQKMPQAHNYNPAFNVNNKFHFSIGTGMHSVGLSNSGFTLKDILVSRPQDDSLVLSPSTAVSKMAKLNFIDLNLQNEIFSAGMKIRKMYFSVGLVNRLDVQFAYPKDFFLLMTEGNGGSLLGQRANMDGLGLNITSYLELAFGANRSFGDKLKVGARMKLLSGVGNVSTKKSVLGLTTDATTFDLTLDGELDLRTSGLSFDSLNYDPTAALKARNKGLAFDFGATYQLSEKLLLSASILDLGSIKWTQNINNYTRSSFSYTFEGVDLNQAVNDSNYFETLKDTLEQIFKVEGNNNSYRSVLPARIIIGANFTLTKNFGAGAFLFSQFSNKKYRPTLLVQGTFNLQKWLTVNLNYSVSARSATNLGLGLGLKGAGMAFFVSTDNLFGFITPAYSKNFHASAGLAFCIGRDKEDKREKKAKEE
jgi:hypothetical protein